MESFGAFLDSESLLATDFFSNHVQIPSSFLAENMYHMVDDSIFFTDFSCVPQEISGDCIEFDCAFLLDHGYGNNVNVNGVDFLHDESILFYPMDCENEPVFPDDMMEEFLQLSNAGKIQAIVSGDHSSEEMQLKRKYETTRIQIDQDKGYQLQSLEDKSEDNSPQSPKKRSRVSKDQNKRNTRSKKNKKVNIPISNDTEEAENINNAAVTSGQSSSSFSSEDDHSNASQDHDGASNSKGKARANRGSATDPQSLYARRRRERINERLRILQNLVPNGTKVDISTMLEEAVHYVKFLQHQIKLLSSDELWMYAPIAYNGMNIGLYDKISPNLWS